MLSNFAINIDSQFEINPKELARGSFGYVNEAWRKSDRKHVAIKTMIDTKIDFEASKCLLRELRLLASISHPKCLQLVAFTLSPTPKIVTPFMGNGSLQDVLDKIYAKTPDPKFTPTKMMCSIYGICSTMQYLHDNSIMHRDFKPLNVFLDDNYDICIADFGLSRKVAENIQLTQSNIGSPLWIAPEIWNGKYESYTNTVDVFSFGVTYLQYFAKANTLDDKKGRIKSSQNLMMRIDNGARFVKPDNMTDDQYQIYITCTDEDPNKRPSFKELCDVFEKNESIWFEGVNKDEYMKYIEECKQINEDLKRKGKGKKQSHIQY